jgi:DNA-binding protein Fis
VIDGGTSEFEILRIREAVRSAGLDGISLKALEAAAILNAMNACEGDRAKAAEMLGISVEALNGKLDSSA